MKKNSRFLSPPVISSLLLLMLATVTASMADVMVLEPENTGVHLSKKNQAANTRHQKNKKENPGDADPAGSAAKLPLAPVAAEPAPAPSPRDNTAYSKELGEQINSHFEYLPSRTSYIQVDKPLYKPGETIWFKTWDLNLRTLAGSNKFSSYRTQVELISPKGASVEKKGLLVTAGTASNDFEIPAEAQGGEYKLRATSYDGKQTERAIIVSAYEAPRVKKTLEFVKKTYAAGDEVTATISVKRPTGEALANQQLVAVATVDGIELKRIKLSANANGDALVKFQLPGTINNGDGLLTILVEDGGVTESISKSIPILQNKLSLAFFPEGGKMVAGLPTRLYFEARTKIGKPAEIEGRLVDDLGNVSAKFSTYKNGLGRVAFTPATGRSYHAEINKPSSITERYDLPVVENHGCVMHHYDDLDGQENSLRIAVQCSQKQKVIVAASVRENALDAGEIEAGPGKPAVIYLQSKDTSMQNAAGISRVTVFDKNKQPLAERLVFRNRRNRLDIQIESDKKTYAPREKMALSITTRDASGKAVATDLALSVVDDTVLSFADDKNATMLSRLLLESELPGKIDEPNFYTDLTEGKSALALDLLMGTRGYRRFDWVSVFNPVKVVEITGTRIIRRDMESAAPVQMLTRPASSLPRQPVPATVAAPVPEVKPSPAMPAPPMERKKEIVADNVILPRRAAMVSEISAKPALDSISATQAYFPADTPMATDQDYRRAMTQSTRSRYEAEHWAAVRVFPLPAFIPDYAGPRDDYRETILWAPSIKTDTQGKATVNLVLSDAVTSFRVSAEGIAHGQAGHNEKVIKSSLPFSLSAKLPLEISSTDQPLIPVTLSNETERNLHVSLDSYFGKLLKATGNDKTTSSLAAGQRQSLFIPVKVDGTQGISEVRLTANTAGLKDEVLRGIKVVASGFPLLLEKSGQIKSEVSHEFDVSKANAGSVQASIKIYTSPVSNMLSGLEGMLRQPSGCFEQTSSTNYPNVMIMQYLKQHDIADTALLDRSNKMLDIGYKRLAGFESPNKGFEWFGADPGHEALTAYGLMQFADMKDVYGAIDEAMLARTTNWLKTRRDGTGGYLRSGKSMGAFGHASATVTDAYITWALIMAGESDLHKELAKSVKLAATTNDAYLLALISASMLEPRSKGLVPEQQRTAAITRLAAMQNPDGSWTNAEQSITRSGGQNLYIETTSIAVLAMLKAGEHFEQARKGVDWLQKNRSGYGQWGATQATVLALKAITSFDEIARVASRPGTVSVWIDGVMVREQSYQAGLREALIFNDLNDLLKPGKHTITLKSKDDTLLPYSIAIEYRSNEPASSSAARIDLSARLAKAEVKMGETVKLEAVISNKTQVGQPMYLVRLGLPGGLTFQNWQLKEMREKGQIDFFETRAREVIFYFRDMKPGEVKKLAIDLVASVPGTYTGPASSAYLYYNDNDKTWTSPLAIRITP